MWRDLQFGFRQLTRNKLLSGTIIALLAIGIGANTLIFSFINSLLLKPLPVRDPQSLFLLEKVREQWGRPDTGFFYRQFEEVSARKDLFSSAVAEQEFTSSSFVPLNQKGTVRMISTAIVSPNYFTELGIHAILGRILTPSDATASHIPVVISYQFWQSQFNKRSNAIGSTIRIKKSPFLIVGVLPRDFHSVDIDRAPDVRLPISAAPAISGHDVRTPDWKWPFRFDILARLAPNVPPGAAAAAIAPQLRATDENISREMVTRSYGGKALSPAQQQNMLRDIKYASDYRIALPSAAHGVSYMRSQFATTLLLLMGGVGLLLLAVCANISGLLLAKAEERKREIAVRLSIGASLWRLARQFLTENLLLAVPGAALGITLAYVLSPALVSLLPSVRGFDWSHATRQILTITPDGRALLFTLAATLVSLLLFGTMPALKAKRLNIDAELKGNSRGATQSLSGVAPIAIQVALCTVLLTGAVLMSKTFWNLQHLNPGFDRAHIVEFTLDPEAVGYSRQQTGTFFSELDARVSTLPGVRSVARAYVAIMRGRGMGTTVAPQGVVLPPKTFLNTSINGVTPSYFETLGIPLLAGRDLEPQDKNHKPQPIVVNKAFADFFFPHQNPTGKEFVTGGTDGTKPPNSVIVGVTGTAKYRSMHEKDTPTFYYLLPEEEGGILYVRTFGNPAPIIGEVRKLLRRLDPKVPLVEVEDLKQEVQHSLWQERLVTILSGFFGLVSLFLAGAGLYGALSYSVSRRTRELGIRLALGATPRHILQTVSANMIAAVIIGLSAGLLSAAFATKFLQRLLFGVQPLDPVAFLITAGCVLLCAAIATALPVLRAMKTDPASALRAE